MKNRIVQMLVIAILFVGVGFVLFNHFSSSKELIREGEQAPLFSLETMNGEKISLSDLKGKGVLINFWATYCIYCLDEMPAIEKQYQRLKDKGIEVLGVNIGENLATVTGYVRRLDVSFPILLDESSEVSKMYQVGPLPQSVFVSPDGKIKHIYIGEMKEKTIESLLQDIVPTS